MKVNKPENSYTHERFVHRYVHPSGLIRWRFLYQKKGQRSQKYFETLEEAIQYRNDFIRNRFPNENIFTVEFS